MFIEHTEIKKKTFFSFTTTYFCVKLEQSKNIWQNVEKWYGYLKKQVETEKIKIGEAKENIKKYIKQKTFTFYFCLYFCLSKNRQTSDPN